MASQVVDILMQRGRDQAAAEIAKGQAWASGITGAGAAIANAMSPEEQANRLKVEGMKRAAASQQQAQQFIAKFKRNEDGTYDEGEFSQGLANAGVSLSDINETMKSVSGINGVIKQSNLDRQERIADAANVLLQAHKGQPISADAVHLTTEALRGSVLHGNDIDQFTNMLGQAGTDDLTPMLTQIRNSAKKYQATKEVPKGGTLVREATGEEVAKGAPEPKTAVELALEAAGGDPKKAMEFLHPSKAAAGTPEQQYLSALQKGDKEGAAQILEAIKKTTEAKQAPVEDVGTKADTKTTATGRQYVDLSKYKGKDYHAAQQQAHAAGVFGASKEEADALDNIETARQNMDLIEKSIGKLPTSAASRGPSLPIIGAIGPGALANRVSANMQLDPDLAAWGTYRTAAIQAMRALAGSKGLRINKSEIETSMANDIPLITDTQATAKEKFERVRKMLLNQENGVMGRAEEAASRGATLREPIPGHPGKFAVSSDNGATWHAEK